jgi:hypothetical protein
VIQGRRKENNSRKAANIKGSIDLSTRLGGIRIMGKGKVTIQAIGTCFSLERSGFLFIERR